MQYRKLGDSGIDVSVVGFGAWAIGGWMWGGSDEQKAIAGIQAALDEGINLIDTAPAYGYGRSEEIVGRAIAGRRDKAVVATKCGLVWDRQDGEFFFHANDQGISAGESQKKIYKCLKPDPIRAEVEASLRRMKIDSIDLLQTHWQESTTPISETMECLLKLKQQGKIRAIGVSNCNVEHLKAYGPIQSDQEKFSILDRAIEGSGVLDYCRQHKIAMLPYSPLANGLLTGKIRPDRQFGEGDLRLKHPRFTKAGIERMNAALATLEPLAQAHKATIAQLVVGWTIAQPGITCVLCGARDATQARENAAAGRLALAADELAQIEAAVAKGA